MGGDAVAVMIWAGAGNSALLSSHRKKDGVVGVRGVARDGVEGRSSRCRTGGSSSCLSDNVGSGDIGG